MKRRWLNECDCTATLAVDTEWVGLGGNHRTDRYLTLYSAGQMLQDNWSLRSEQLSHGNLRGTENSSSPAFTSWASMSCELFCFICRVIILFKNL